MYTYFNIVVGQASRCTHYCGRPKSYRNVGADLSILGNPFPIPFSYNYNPKAVSTACASYRKYFKRQLKENPKFLEALETIKDDSLYQKITLGCFCKTKQYPDRECHCDTIKEYVENMEYLPLEVY